MNAIASRKCGGLTHAQFTVAQRTSARDNQKFKNDAK